MKTKNVIRILLATVLLLMIPFVSMQFTNSVDWDARDFTIMGLLMIGFGLLYEFIVSKLKNATQRLVLAFALAAVFLLIWADLAVGIFNIPGISGS